MNPKTEEQIAQEKKFYDSLPISKEEIEKRISMVWLDFSLCLPIYDEETRRNIRMMMDIDTAELIPEWFFDLGTACKMYIPQFADYLKYIQEAIPFIFGTTNTRPPIDVDESLRDDILKDIQRKQMIAQIKAKRQEKKEKKKVKRLGGG